MGIADDMKNLGEEIIASYKQRTEEFQQRVKDNDGLVKEVQETLEGFRKDHQEMAKTLRAGLSKAEINRKEYIKNFRDKDFMNLMAGINDSISAIEKDVDHLRKSTIKLMSEISTSHNTMATVLRENLSKAESTRLKMFNEILKGIHYDISVIQQDVKNTFLNTGTLLERYNKDHSEMAKNLKAELSQNVIERIEFTSSLINKFHEQLMEISSDNKTKAKELHKKLDTDDMNRLKEYQETIEDIRKKIGNINSFTANLLKEFNTERSQMAENLSKLYEIVAELKSKNEIIEKPIETLKTIKKEPRRTLPKVDVKAEPKKEVIEKEEPKKTEMTVEEKVLKYINNHPKGVKVSEMEKPLGEQRMRLGYVAKRLLEDGKILKLENAYYPKPKKEI